MTPKLAQVQFEQGQGSLLPPREAGLALNGVVRAVAVEDGGFFAPVSASETPVTVVNAAAPSEVDQAAEQSPELRSLTFEVAALDDFAKESSARGRVINRSSRARALSRQDESHPDIEPLKQEAEAAKRAEREHRLSAKENLGLACGIKAIRQKIFDSEEDAEQNRNGRWVVIAQDRARRDELNAAYRAFRLQYAEKDNRKTRDTRRKQLKIEIAARQATPA